MKFNNKFDLVEYLQVVTEIVQDYFDLNTHEYMPHIGEINSVCVYYNHCVEPEDYDELPHPITDIHDMEKLFNNVEFMAHYRSEVNDYIDEFGLTFGAAYDKAMDIVEYKKRGYFGVISFFNTYTHPITDIIDDMFCRKELISHFLW